MRSPPMDKNNRHTKYVCLRSTSMSYCVGKCRIVSTHITGYTENSPEGLISCMGYMILFSVSDAVDRLDDLILFFYTNAQRHKCLSGAAVRTYGSGVIQPGNCRAFMVRCTTLGADGFRSLLFFHTFAPSLLNSYAWSRYS